MSVNPIQNLTNIVLQQSQPGAQQPQQWKVGQTLSAVVLNSPRPGAVLLNIAGNIVQAKSPAPLQPGQAIKVEVAQINQQLTLKLPAASSNTPSPVAQLVNNLTPQQQQIAPFLANLVAVARGKTNPLRPTTTPNSALRNATGNGGKTVDAVKKSGATVNTGQHKPQADVQQQHVKQQATHTPAKAAPAQSQQPAQAANKLPPEMHKAVEKLLASLPKPKEVMEPKGLKQAIQDSGILFEKKLLAFKDNPKLLAKLLARDFKANLFRLFNSAQHTTPQRSQPSSNTSTSVSNPSSTAGTATKPQINAYVTTRQLNTQNLQGLPLRGTITPLPAPQTDAAALQQQAKMGDPLEIIKQTLSSIARTQMTQIASLPTEAQHTTSISVELPLLNGNSVDLLQLLIEEEPDEGHGGDEEAAEEKTWTITLAFDLANLGPMHVKVAINGDHVAANWQVQQPKTLRSLEREIGVLCAMLEQEGLRVDDMEMQLEQQPKPPSGSHILDVEA